MNSESTTPGWSKSGVLIPTAQPLFPTRFFNFLLRFQKHPFLYPDQLIKAAELRAKLTDWGEESFSEGLEVYCRSVNSDAGMHRYGLSIVKRLAVDRLADKLRIEQALRNQPEIEERPVVKPIMIVGQPRTGSTFLHRLFAQDPQFRVPRFWEIYHPVPPPDPETYETDGRIRKVGRELKLIDWVAPAFYNAHPVEASSAEECYPLLERVMNKPVSCIWLDIPEYQDWLLSRDEPDVAGDYRYYRKQLQILQFRFRGARWVLKAPVHAFFLGSIAEVFPDVRFIQTHRTPLKTAPSSCSLAAHLRTVLYDSEDYGRLGQRLLKYGEVQAGRFLDSREKIGPGTFSDVYFEDLVRDPLMVMRELYEELQLELEPSTELRMQRFLEVQSRGRHTRHRYSLEQFGLNEALVKGRFERYLEEFPRLRT